MSNIVTTVPIVRPAHQQPSQGKQLVDAGPEDAPAEPQITVATVGTGEPILAD